MVERPLCAHLVGGVLKEAGEALQGHVLEGRGRPVEQLEHVGAVPQVHDRGDALVVPLVAVGACHERGHVGRLHIDVEGVVHEGGPLGVGQVGQGADGVHREGRDRLRHEQAAARRDAAHDGLGKRIGLDHVAARVDECVHGSPSNSGGRPRGRAGLRWRYGSVPICSRGVREAGRMHLPTNNAAGSGRIASFVLRGHGDKNV